MGNKRSKDIDEDDADLLDDSDDNTPLIIKRKKYKPEEDEDETQPKKKREKRLKEDFDFRISHTHDGKLAKLLRSRGVSPLDLMHGTKSFNLEDVVQPIDSQVYGGKVKKINAQKQLNWYESSYKRVLGQSWLSAGIGGVPTDSRAKQVALHLFIKAIEEYQNRDPRKNTNRSLPLWHNIYGGFGDSLRDLKSDYPSFIVLSNITPECTGLKFEKIRDILTKFNNMDIPVVVVSAGFDPYTLFSSRLYYPMRWCVFCGNGVIQI